MARLARSATGVREAYTAHVRELCETPAGRLQGCPWPALLARLEAGESVPVAGWEVGFARDFGRYWLDADGRLEPMEVAQ